jgi:hypothetical protein
MAVPCGGGKALWKLPLPIVNGTTGGIAYVSKTYDSPWRVATLVQAADGKSSIILLGGTTYGHCKSRHPGSYTSPTFNAFAAIRVPAPAQPSSLGNYDAHRK